MSPDCYCEDRKPGVYCGVCQVCGKPGHTRAHPNLPTTGAWCDEHWAELLARPGLTPDLIFRAVIIIVTLGIFIVMIWRLVF